jgi:DNA-binding transcriptional ArsR family regulator
MKSGLSLSVLFKILGNKVRVSLLEALAREESSLTSLCMAVGRSKPLVCIHLSKLHEHGFIEKRGPNHCMTYHLASRKVLRIIKEGKSYIDSLKPKKRK